jgi:hypothetical protein
MPTHHFTRVGSVNVERPAHQSEGGGSNPTPTLQKSEWVVESIDLVTGQEMVRQHHYSRGGSNTAVYMHGLVRRSDRAVMGVAWWLPPTRVACESVDKQNWKRVLSLTRLVCLPDAPKNAASFLLAHSTRLIRKDGRFVALVTYADESQGHTGAIYRAAGWEYVGRTGPYPRWVDPVTGQQKAPKATKNRTKAEMEALGYVKVGSFYKHKFVLRLDEAQEVAA